MNRFHAAQIQDAYRETLLELKPNLMVTHNFWGKQKAETQCDRMKQFYCAIQREAFGRDWARQFNRLWPSAYGFREHPHSNPHYHVLVRACPILTAAITTEGAARWAKLARHGQLHVEPILPGKLEPIIYCTKHLTHEQAIGDIFIYSDTRTP